jgi:tetratricopeptide (TPR) repeat protein
MIPSSSLVLLLLLLLPAAGGEVPFIAQKPNSCGPAALAMVANYYGNPVTQDEIAAAITTARGTVTAELAAHAGKLGFWVRAYRGSLADLRQKTAAGVPLIVLGKFGGNDHYFVVLRLDDWRKTVTVHSDTRANLEMSQEAFGRYWGRANEWTLLVCPPPRATWKLTAEEHNDLGVFLEKAGQLAQAAGHYLRATELAPAKSYYHLNLGNALLKQKLYAEAAAAYGKAVQTAPDNADALNNLANAYLELGANLDEAERLCRRAIELRPAHRAYYLDTLGAVLLKQGKTSEAMAAFAQALAAATDRQESLRDAIRQRLKALQ